MKQQLTLNLEAVQPRASAEACCISAWTKCRKDLLPKAIVLTGSMQAESETSNPADSVALVC